MNSDDIKLVASTYGPLTGNYGPIQDFEFDDNNIAIYKDFESLAITLGVPAYDAGTTYNNDYNDNTTETFATYGNRFWQWINVSDGNSTPAEGSDWTQIFPTMLAHEKNKDNRLTHPNGNFEITLSDEDIAGEEVPRAAIKAVDPSGVNYFVSVQDTTNLGEGFEVDIGAVSDDGTGLSVEINSTTATISHKTTGTTTNGITIENGKIRIRTPQQIAGNLSNGDVFQLIDASTGEIEGTNVAALNGTGWGSYVDTQYPDALNAFTLPALTETVLPNNAGTIIQDQMPLDVTAFYYGGKLDVGSIVGTFVQGETITGGTSGATAIILYVGVDFLAIRDITGTFSVSETVTGGTSGATATISAADQEGTITGRNGDSLDVMIYFKAVPSAISQYLDIWIDITGGTGTPTNLANLYRQTFSFPKGAGVERGILYALPSGYTLSTWESNGGKVKIYSDAALDIYQINYNLDRSHKAIL